MQDEGQLPQQEQEQLPQRGDVTTQDEGGVGGLEGSGGGGGDEEKVLQVLLAIDGARCHLLPTRTRSKDGRPPRAIPIPPSSSSSTTPSSPSPLMTSSSSSPASPLILTDTSSSSSSAPSSTGNENGKGKEEKKSDEDEVEEEVEVEGRELFVLCSESWDEVVARRRGRSVDEQKKEAKIKKENEKKEKKAVSEKKKEEERKAKEERKKLKDEGKKAKELEKEEKRNAKRKEKEDKKNKNKQKGKGEEANDEVEQENDSQENLATNSSSGSPSSTSQPSSPMTSSSSPAVPPRPSLAQSPPVPPRPSIPQQLTLPTSSPIVPPRPTSPSPSSPLATSSSAGVVTVHCPSSSSTSTTNMTSQEEGSQEEVWVFLWVVDVVTYALVPNISVLYVNDFRYILPLGPHQVLRISLPKTTPRKKIEALKLCLTIHCDMTGAPPMPLEERLQRASRVISQHSQNIRRTASQGATNVDAQLRRGSSFIIARTEKNQSRHRCTRIGVHALTYVSHGTKKSSESAKKGLQGIGENVSGKIDKEVRGAVRTAQTTKYAVTETAKIAKTLPAVQSKLKKREEKRAINAKAKALMKKGTGELKKENQEDDDNPEKSSGIVAQQMPRLRAAMKLSRTIAKSASELKTTMEEASEMVKDSTYQNSISVVSHVGGDDLGAAAQDTLRLAGNVWKTIENVQEVMEYISNPKESFGKDIALATASRIVDSTKQDDFEKPIKEGLLMKRGEFVDFWKERYCVLKPRSLQFYHKKPERRFAEEVVKIKLKEVIPESVRLLHSKPIIDNSKPRPPTRQALPSSSSSSSSSSPNFPALPSSTNSSSPLLLPSSPTSPIVPSSPSSSSPSSPSMAHLFPSAPSTPVIIPATASGTSASSSTYIFPAAPTGPVILDETESNSISSSGSSSASSSSTPSTSLPTATAIVNASIAAASTNHPVLSAVAAGSQSPITSSSPSSPASGTSTPTRPLFYFGLTCDGGEEHHFAARKLNEAEEWIAAIGAQLQAIAVRRELRKRRRNPAVLPSPALPMTIGN